MESFRAEQRKKIILKAATNIIKSLAITIKSECRRAKRNHRRNYVEISDASRLRKVLFLDYVGAEFLMNSECSFKENNNETLEILIKT